MPSCTGFHYRVKGENDTKNCSVAIVIPAIFVIKKESSYV